MRKNLLLEDTRNERIIKGYIKKALPQYAQYWNVPIGDTPIYRRDMGVKPETPTMTFYKNYFLSAFDISRGKGPVKFIPGIARIAFDELGFLKTTDVSDNNILRLKNLVLFLSHSELGNQYDENLNGVDFVGLEDAVGSAMKQSNAANRERLSKMAVKGGDYQIVPIHSFEEACRYGNCTTWCVTYSKTNYDSYTTGGRRFYFLLKRGFENIEMPQNAAAEGAPLDAYGLSMISVLVDIDGEPAYVTTRWNHEHNGENNPDFRTAEDVQKVTGINFYKQLVPYSREELRAMGITPFEDVPEMLAQGLSLGEIFDNTFDVGLIDIWGVKLNNKRNLLHYIENRILLRRWVNTIGDFREGFAQVKLNDKWGLIDKSGREVVPCRYDDINDFSEGFARVKLNDKWGLIDKSGREVVPCKYDFVSLFSEGFARVKLNDKWGLIDKSGRDVVPCKYDLVYDFSEGFAQVKLNDKWGFVDKSGREVVPCRYDFVSLFSEGLAVVNLNGKWGFIDKSGREVVPCRYNKAHDFQEGFAQVVLNGKWGFVDKSGREVIPCRYDWANPFYKGLAMAELYGKLGYIDKNGNWYNEKPSNLQENTYLLSVEDIHRLTNESLKKYKEKKRKSKRVPSAQEQVGGKVNAGLLDGAYGLMEEEPDFYIGMEGNSNAEFAHVSQGSAGAPMNEEMVWQHGSTPHKEMTGFKPNIQPLIMCWQMPRKSGKRYSDEDLRDMGYYSAEPTRIDESKKLTKDEYLESFKSIGNYMDKNGLKVKPFPKVKIDNSEQDGLFIKTGYYVPEKKLIVIFTKDRHPKDILRSFTHEMVHHAQNLRGDDLAFYENDDVKNNERLEKIESEAYLKGNIYFRKWTEYFKNGEEKELLNESIKKSDIDFRSFKIQDKLNPKFWKDDKLDPKIRLSLLKIADDFIKWVGVKFNHSDITITGSLANYTWNKKYSDIDLHILVDFSKFKGGKAFAKEFFSAKKSLWNEKHEKMKILGYPVEIYVQDTAEFHKSNGIYSLEKDSWIKEPDKETLSKGKIDKKNVKDAVINYADNIDDIERAFKEAKSEYELRQIEKDAEKILSDIRNERKSGFKNNDSEINDGNVIFKTLRRLGYIGKIIDLIDDIYDKKAGFEI